MKPNRWIPFAACALLATGALAQDRDAPAPKEHETVRPGLYGQIHVRHGTPPLIYEQPVTVEQPEQARQAVYLYVPPGQVRRWPQNCAKWDACDRPVYFVRVDDSPSRLGAWKKTQRPEPAESAMLHALNRFTQ